MDAESSQDKEKQAKYESPAINQEGSLSIDLLRIAGRAVLDFTTGTLRYILNLNTLLTKLKKEKEDSDQN